MKSQLRRYLGSLVFVFLLCLSVAVGATAGVLFVYNSDLPQVNSLEDYHPSLITEVYSDDGQVIGSFALERRFVVTWDQIPQVVKDAIISVEDQNFYSHWGIDFLGVARASVKNLMAGRVVEGDRSASGRQRVVNGRLVLEVLCHGSRGWQSTFGGLSRYCGVTCGMARTVFATLPRSLK